MEDISDSAVQGIELNGGYIRFGSPGRSLNWMEDISDSAVQVLSSAQLSIFSQESPGPLVI